MGTVIKIFILHGWTYSTEKWDPFINFLKQKGFEVNMLKIPGLTDKLDTIWEINDYVEWLKRTFDNQQFSNETMKPASPSLAESRRAQGGQPNNKVILIGHSNGGRIALNFAIKFPNSLSHLILIDSAGVYHNELSVKIKRLVFGSIAKAGKKLNSSDKIRNLFYKIVGESDYKNANPTMKQTMLNLINSDKDLKLSKVTIPTLIIWGREDKTTPLSDGKLMNKQIKNSTLGVIKDARHSPQFSHAKELAAVIVNKLSLRS